MTRVLSRTTLSLSATLVLAFCASMAIAREEAKDPTVRARMALMDNLKKNLTVVGDMATGKAAFDAQAARAATEALRADATQVVPAFTPEVSDPVSHALPRLWENMGEFRQKARHLARAAEALDPSSQSGLAAGLNALGASCKDCHGRFKAD